MKASLQSTVRRIELVINFLLDGEPECSLQQLSVQFLGEDTAVAMLSSGTCLPFFPAKLIEAQTSGASPSPSGSQASVTQDSRKATEI